jgi:hypothetical protein
MINYDRLILALDDTQLELFVRDWVNVKSSTYVSVARFSGSGDLGRDVVGFLSTKKHEGPWHNYQCKQYAKRLPTETAIHEIGKILYYAFMGEFVIPEKYFFVAPRGVNRNLEKLIFNPATFKKAVIEKWDEYCANTIVEGTNIPLSPDLKKVVEDYDFANIQRLSIDDILNDSAIKPVLFKWFGTDPGPAPRGKAPVDIDDSELPYIGQLLEAYGQRESCTFRTHHELQQHPSCETHLRMQRERFYDADAFKRFYRDNTDPKVISEFETDIHHGIVDTYNLQHNDALQKVDAVMIQAANLQAAGPLAQHARVPVKQGICHHFANEEILKWKK